MSIIALDFESFYDTEYSLSKMSTEAYIRHPHFEVIGVSISTNGRPAVWYPQPDVETALRSIDWSKNSLLAWNTVFDGAILAWHYNIYPALYLDAMGVAKAQGKTYKGASLAKVAELMGVGIKGAYVAQAKGKRVKDFAPHELAEYGRYCCNDTDLTVKLYRLLSVGFPLSEVKVQDLNLRLFIEPLLQFDVDTLQDHYDDVVNSKSEKIIVAMQHVGVETEAELQKTLASNPKFAQALKDLGVEPPVKLSPTTGKETWAFAKTDPEFMELQESDDIAVQALVAARLGVKSTIEETRAQAFLEIASRGPWPVQYNYYGGHPGRFSGAGNANPQNLKRGGKLRDSILPPPGHAILCADLSQIECRFVNYVAEQDDVVENFRLHDEDSVRYPDVYCILAEKLYRRTITPKDKQERQSGKVAELSLGFGGGWEAYKRGMFKEANRVVPEHEARNVVDIYRSTHHNVRALWKQGDVALASMVRRMPFVLGCEGVLHGNNPTEGIGLPNGLYLRYPELRQEWDSKKQESSYVYSSRKGPKRIYGAIVVQNFTEALARIALTDAWLRLSSKLRIVFHTHDELVAVVPHNNVEWALELMTEEMTRAIPWALGLPLACEASSGGTYGEAKSK